MRQSRVVAAVFAGALAAVGTAESQAEVNAGAAVEWGWAGHDLDAPFRYGLYGYGWTGPWGPFGAGAYVDNPYLRRAIRRELERQEYFRELDERAQRSFEAAATSPYGMRREQVPPTPEAQVQPAYRGSGEIRPEFRGTGQSRQDFAAPSR